MAKRAKPTPLAAQAENALYYGDNLEVLRQFVADESVDLIYLDPPFNSKADYNVLFAEQDGSRAAAQIKAFGDTWRWDQAAALAYEEFVVSAPHQASQVMQAFRAFLGESDMLAYLAMMAPRLVELHRVLKPTGSLYLHCDPTASHYLKLILDATFGPANFRSEVIWKRTGAHGGSRRYGPVHDTLFFYSKGADFTWNQQYQDQSQYIEKRYTYSDPDGRRFYPVTLHASGTRNGASGLPWRGIDITAKGGHWKYTVERLDQLDASGMIYWPQRGSMPRLKMYAESAKGSPLQDLWTDIPAINSQAQERLGYPTQKPESLLDRIISASSNQGEVILDPFCGCGTAIAVAQKLGRRWAGIDITHLAISLIKSRLRDAYGDSIARTFRVFGEPVSLYDSATLAEEDRYQFQYWALGLVGARPMPADQKKGADRGIDGRIRFHDDTEGGKTKQIILSVKSGKTDVSHVRDLRGVIEREKAEIGVLISLQEPTAPMKTEAASAGFYSSPWQTKHPRLQVLTIADLLDGRGIDMPPSRDLRTFKKSPKVKGRVAKTPTLTFGDDD